MNQETFFFNPLFDNLKAKEETKKKLDSSPERTKQKLETDLAAPVLLERKSTIEYMENVR